MNIVYLISRAKKGAGPINQASYILAGLKRIPDVHAILVTLAPEVEGDSWLNKFTEQGIEVLQLNQPAKRIFYCVGLLKRIIREKKIDIVHSAGYRADFVNMLLRKSVVTITTQRCLPNVVAEGSHFLLRPFMTRWHLLIIKKLQRIVACSQSLQKAFDEDYHLKVDVAQNAVNTDFYTPVVREDKINLRRQFNLPEEKRIFLVLGTFRPRKNVGSIIDAFVSINNSNSVLLLVGGGWQENDLRQKASPYNNIVFTGTITNAKPYLQASDILVSSSLAEGLPNTVLEAISCGLPCILSDIEPHLEILEGSSVSLFFDRNSSVELAEAMQKTQSWNLDEMSVKARELALSRFGISRLASNYYDIYKRVLENK